MSKTYSPVEVNLDVEAGREKSRGTPEPETPFRIAVLGDFSGQANRDVTNPGAHRAASQPILIDRDNFDQVMAKLDVELRLPLAGRGGAGIRLHFAELSSLNRFSATRTSCSA